jgi:hypothetical protein
VKVAAYFATSGSKTIADDLLKVGNFNSDSESLCRLDFLDSR